MREAREDRGVFRSQHGARMGLPPPGIPDHQSARAIHLVDAAQVPVDSRIRGPLPQRLRQRGLEYAAKRPVAGQREYAISGFAGLQFQRGLRHKEAFR